MAGASAHADRHTYIDTHAAAVTYCVQHCYVDGDPDSYTNSYDHVHPDADECSHGNVRGKATSPLGAQRRSPTGVDW